MSTKGFGDDQRESEGGSAFVGLAPFAVGVFLGVLVVQAIARPPVAEAGGTAAVARTVVGAVGALAALVFAVACAGLGGRWFLAGRREDFGRHLLGATGVALSLALVAGGLAAGSGGSLGAVFPRTFGPVAGAVLGVVLGLAALAATVWLSWLGDSAAGPALEALRERLSVRRLLPKALLSRKAKTAADKSGPTRGSMGGVSPEEADALLPPPVSSPPVSAAPIEAPPAPLPVAPQDEPAGPTEPLAPYPVDLRPSGGIPADAQPLETPASAPAAPSEAPDPDSTGSPSVYRWTPGGAEPAGVAPDADLAATGSGRAVEDDAPASADRPAGEQPEATERPAADAARLSDPGAPPAKLSGRPVPADARVIGEASAPGFSPPRPSWERAAEPRPEEKLEVASPAPQQELASETPESTLAAEQTQSSEPEPAAERDPMALLDDELARLGITLDDPPEATAAADGEAELAEAEALLAEEPQVEPDLEEGDQAELEAADEEELELEAELEEAELEEDGPADELEFVAQDEDEELEEVDEVEEEGEELVAEAEAELDEEEEDEEEGEDEEDWEYETEPEEELVAELDEEDPEAEADEEEGYEEEPEEDEVLVAELEEDEEDEELEGEDEELEGEPEELVAELEPPTSETLSEDSEAAQTAASGVQHDLFDPAAAEPVDLTALAPGSDGDEAPAEDDLAATEGDEPEVVLTPQATPEGATAHKKLSQLAIDAGSLFVSEERVAVSMLQRQFGIDFEQCCTVLDELQNTGLIGPYMGGQRRDILMTRDEWRQHVGQV